MKISPRNMMAVAGVLGLMAIGSNAQASYASLEAWLAAGSPEYISHGSDAPASGASTPAGDAYTFLGTSPTGWNPGADTAGFLSSTHPLGSPGAASWSIMPAGTLSDGFDPHGGAGTPTSALTGIIPGLASGTEAASISAALAVWASASGFSSLGMVADGGAAFNTPEPGPGNTLFGDIRLGAIAIDGATGVLAHGFQPGTAATFPGTPTIGGDIHFDSAELWCDYVLDPTCGGMAGTGFDFFSVALHELGHALGLGHTDVVGAVMYPFISAGTPVRTLHADDIAGITAIYGPAAVPEPATWVLFASVLLLLGWRRTRAL